MHTPDQNILDYKAQRDARNAANIALTLTVMAGLFGSFLFSTLAVRLFIGKYTANFFPGYVPLKAAIHVRDGSARVGALGDGQRGCANGAVAGPESQTPQPIPPDLLRRRLSR
ncbi:hypothetical protein [Acidithiobacillus sp.]|jgi:hypothetical protein|uniref:hypothetical protein n=1 Tax=Acidithiobacillus sp. TaxID=1872118 RepID=UPI00343C9426